MANRTKDLKCIHRGGCPKPNICGEYGHCTSMPGTDLLLWAQNLQDKCAAMSYKQADTDFASARTGVSPIRYACKFCACVHGLKGAEVPSLPDTEVQALKHVAEVHGYPAQRSAQDILGGSEQARLAAKLIDEIGPVWRVQYVFEP